MLIYGNDRKSNSHYSFTSPLNSSVLNKIPKRGHLNQHTQNKQSETIKDYSKIILQGKKLSNNPIDCKAIKLKRKEKSQPKLN